MYQERNHRIFQAVINDVDAQTLSSIYNLSQQRIRQISKKVAKDIHAYKGETFNNTLLNRSLFTHLRAWHEYYQDGLLAIAIPLDNLSEVE